MTRLTSCFGMSEVKGDFAEVYISTKGIYSGLDTNSG